MQLIQVDLNEAKTVLLSIKTQSIEMNLLGGQGLDRKCWYYTGEVEEEGEFKMKLPSTCSPPCCHAVSVQEELIRTSQHTSDPSLTALLIEAQINFSTL